MRAFYTRHKESLYNERSIPARNIWSPSYYARGIFELYDRVTGEIFQRLDRAYERRERRAATNQSGTFTGSWLITRPSKRGWFAARIFKLEITSLSPRTLTFLQDVRAVHENERRRRALARLRNERGIKFHANKSFIKLACTSSNYNTYSLFGQSILHCLLQVLRQCWSV